MPGVLGVWTGKDLEAAGYNPFTCGLPLKSRDGSPLLQTNRPALPTDKVRFVGDPVAFVVAETLAQARDAAEAVELDIEPLPAVTDAAEATKPGAPQLYDHIPNNVALDYHYGDTAKIDAAFASAAHVTKLDIVNTRVAVVSMEPRVALAAYDKASERFTLQVPTQGVAGNKAGFAKILNVPTDKVRILTANVGGSFGMKNMNYPEYTCIAHAAKVLGRPVKWTDERSTSFLSDSQGRAQLIHAELALDAEGKFLAVRLQGYGNLGAYITGVAPGPLSLNTGKNLASVYRTPLLGVDIKTVLTNTTLMGAYRGAGRPEANYYMERLIDRAADEMGINRLTCASATSSSRRNCRSRRPPASPMTAAISQASSTRRWRFPTTPISPSARRKARRTASCAASRSAPISKSPRRRAANSARSPSSRTVR